MFEVAWVTMAALRQNCFVAMVEDTDRSFLATGVATVGGDVIFVHISTLPFPC